MSTAPSSAYQTSKAKAVLATGADTFTSYRDLLLAKFLQNTTATDDWGDGYFNSADDAATRIAKIKDIFKIDGWARIEQGGGVEGFVGYCYSRTSGNGLYHNWDNNTSPFVARGSGVKLDTTVLDAELLNDAGLNRKADITITPTSDPLWTFWANWINFPMSMRASFYDGVTDYGYSWKIGAGSYTDVSTLADTGGGTIGVKAAKTQLAYRIDIATLDESETVYFKPYITSGEGTFYGAPVTFTAEETLAMPQGVTKVDGANGAPIVGGNYIIYATAAKMTLLTDGITITTSDASTGIFLHLSEYFDTLLPEGYYVIDSTTKAYLVNSYGEVRKYETRTPATASVSFYLLNLGMEEFPEWRVMADVFDASEFPNTLTVATVVTYYTKSGGTYTPTGSTVNVDINLVDGQTNAQSDLSLIAPPAGATYARVTTETTGIGLAVISNYRAI